MPGPALDDAQTTDLRDRLAIQLLCAWMPIPYSDAADGAKAVEFEERARRMSRIALLVADAFIKARLDHTTAARK